MSAPATNDLSPAPVRTITRTASSRFNSSTARRRSSRVEWLRALRTFGRLIVTMATAESRSISRLSKVIAGSNYIPGVQRERRGRRTNRVRNDIQYLDASQRNERLVKLIADSVGCSDRNRRHSDSERDATMPASSECADEQRAQSRIQRRVQILVDSADKCRRFRNR